jgi:hypothetical protein
MTSTPGNRLAHGADTEGVRRVHGDHRRRLRQPVPLQDHQAGGVEELVDLGRERCAAGHEIPQAFAGAHLELREHQLLCDPVLHGEHAARLGAGEGDVGPPLRDAARPVENPALDGTAGEGVVQYARVHLFVETRDGEHERRPHDLHVDRHGLDGLGVRDRRAHVEHEIMPRHPLEDVRQRQKAQAGVAARVERNLRGGGEYVGDEVVMREHDAFRLAGRAGRVNERGDVGGLRRERARGVVRATGRRVRGRAVRLEIRHREIRARVSLRRKGDHVPQGRTFLTHRDDLCGLGDIAHEERDCPRVLEDVGRLLRRQVGVEWHVGNARGDACVVGDRPFRSVLRKDGHPVARRYAQVAQSERDAPHTVGQFAARDRPIGALHLHLQRVGFVVLRHGVKEQLAQRAGLGIARTSGCDHHSLRVSSS